jgi:DNA-binding IclR family transcriptional regulator
MSQTVHRAASLLLWLAKQPLTDSGGRKLGEIAAGVELDKATTHRLLQSLVSVGFVKQDPESRHYSLGSAALHLAGAAREVHPFLQRCAPIVERLAAETNETVSLSERRGLENVTIHEVESQQVVRYANKIGRASSLHVAAGALAVLAWSPEDIIERVLSQPLERYTSRTITGPDELRNLIATARRNGYTHSFGQRHEGVHSLAVPICSQGRTAAGAASIIWPSRGKAEDRRRIKEWPALLMSAFQSVSCSPSRGAA